MTRSRHPVDDIADGIKILERKISTGTPAQRASSRYQLAVLLLSKYGWTYEAKLLSQAREQLNRAIEIRPKHARTHGALGYAYDLSESGAERALACFREAHRLNPRDREYDVYVLTLLRETGREQEALAEIEVAAPRHGVDLHALRRDLAEAGMPSDAGALLGGFIHARNFFKSSLSDEADRTLNALQPGRARREAVAQRRRCIEDQRELERSFDASRVPESVRALASWASRYGIGDDVCRPYLLGRLGKKQRATLIREVDERAQPIQAWLDSFGGGLMPTEAAAFMYLTIGVEEIREQS
jgi:tetratricopeptide (TPR) repeat protein